MQIDCRNLACPEPVIKTKNALTKMKIGQKLEILVNDIAPKENIKRFLSSNFLEYEIEENEKDFIIKTIKTNEIKEQNLQSYSCETVTKKQKIIYLNDDRAGVGDVGRGLLSKFLGAVLNLQDKPAYIICINNAVYMTTNRAHVSYPVLKELEKNGIEILTCGSCLEAYKLVDKLSIGKMTNAYEVMSLLFKYEVIKL